ncbi:MAG: hypothetical protein AAFP19_13560 [Bacteroidota bacterium]
MSLSPRQSLWQQLKESPFIIRLLHWEYWPMTVTNIPVVLCWLYYALRARSLFFFSTANPVIETGGVFGESKINILKRIPEAYLPITVFVAAGTSFQQLKQEMQAAGLHYPIIAKPNVGERGFLVTRIEKEEELIAYLNQHAIDFLVQEFVAWPLELSVMHYRMPADEHGEVTSICIKETLKVQGDGQSTVEELMANKARAKLQLPRFRMAFPALLQQIPNKGEWLELEPIGNHSRGTMFLNGNAHISGELHALFNSISQRMEGIYYGRFDMKCKDMESLKAGKGFKILEFNGIASEPAHIYDPTYPLLQKYKDIFWHWNKIYQISQQQMARGIKAMTLKEAIQALRDYFGYMRMVRQTQKEG